jgi:hypothetical protein
MFSFLISTIAFFLAAYALNRYFDAQELDSSRARKTLVMVVATFISIGAGWFLDKLDGDAALPQNNVSITEVIQSGDPVQIAKVLVGIN